DRSAPFAVQEGRAPRERTRRVPGAHGMGCWLHPPRSRGRSHAESASSSTTAGAALGFPGVLRGKASRAPLTARSGSHYTSQRRRVGGSPGFERTYLADSTSVYKDAEPVRSETSSPRTLARRLELWAERPAKGQGACDVSTTTKPGWPTSRCSVRARSGTSA